MDAGASILPLSITDTDQFPTDDSTSRGSDSKHVTVWLLFVMLPGGENLVTVVDLANKFKPGDSNDLADTGINRKVQKRYWNSVRQLKGATVVILNSAIGILFV